MQSKSIYIKIYNVTFTTFWYIEFRLSVVNFGIMHRRVLEFWLNAYIWIVSDMKKMDFQNSHLLEGLPFTQRVKNSQNSMFRGNLWYLFAIMWFIICVILFSTTVIFLGNTWENRSINDEMVLISIAGIGKSEKEQ